ncbi:hypothetical protein IAI18_06885 [Acetobacteraceae bacterium H6797]|nr:hypothetical protein [Acetobacteraceae bacterium H6797]
MVLQTSSRAFPVLALTGLLAFAHGGTAQAAQDWRVFADEACINQDVPWYGNERRNGVTFHRTAAERSLGKEGEKAPHEPQAAEPLPYGPAMRLCALEGPERSPARRT